MEQMNKFYKLMDLVILLLLTKIVDQKETKDKKEMMVLKVHKEQLVKKDKKEMMVLKVLKEQLVLKEHKV